MGSVSQYQFSYLNGAAVVLDAAPAASSLRNGLGCQGEVGKDGQLAVAIPRPKKRLIGRGPVDFIGQEMPAPQVSNQGSMSASVLNDSTILEDEYSVSKQPLPLSANAKEGNRRSILLIGSLRVDISLFECILRVRSGCYLLPQAGARAIVVVLEIPPQRPRMVEDLDEEDEQYVLIQSSEEEGDPVVHPAIESFEECLKQFANLVDMAGGGVKEKQEKEKGKGEGKGEKDEQNDIVDGTSLRESDQNHLVKFANSVFAECDQLLVNTSTKQGVAPVVASSIKVTGNILCKTLLTTSTVAGTSLKVFGKALREVIPQNEKDAKLSESTLKNIETAEWIGEKAVNASEFLVSTTSKAVQYTGRVVSDKILQSNVSQYWTELDGTGVGSEQNGFFQTMGTILDAMVTSAVDLQLAVQKSTWSLLNDLKDTAIDIVDHKYGTDAAEATGKSVSAALKVGSATVSAASIARGPTMVAKGVAKGVAKESGDQIVSMEGWMGGVLQMYGVFETKGATGWSHVWAVLRPDALAMYSPADLVQERPIWVVPVMNISEVTRENFSDESEEVQEEQEDCLGQEEGEAGEPNEDKGEEGENGAQAEVEEEEKEAEEGKDKVRTLGQSCKLHLTTRSHGSWSFRFESEASGKKWCEALLRCIRSNARCKLLGCLLDGEKLC
jgi:hypothetical protein